MTVKRSVENYLAYVAEHFPVVVITGARQVGKSTLIKKFAKERGGISYVTLDYPVLRNLAKTDPELFLQKYEPPILVEEAVIKLLMQILYFKI